MTIMPYHLKVDGNHVRQALRQFHIPRKYPPNQKASLAFDGRYFSIIMLDCAVALSAEGAWPGDVPPEMSSAMV